MQIKSVLYSILFVLLIITVLSAFKNSGGDKNKVYKDQVVVHILSDPKGLNPLTVSDATTKNYLAPYLFQPLLNYDYKTLQLLPILATEVPQVIVKGDELEVTFNIRPEATWDNGTPITSTDVEFSMKAVMCPKAQTAHLQSACDYIKDIITYPNDNKKITFICTKFIDVIGGFGVEVKILPEYVFDPNKILRKYSIAQFKNPTEAVQEAKDLKEFTDVFNSDKSARDASMIIGSGAYKLVSFETGQRVIIERKQHWWGDKMNHLNHYFDAYPKRLVFETINDFNTAFTALKNEQIDWIFSTPVKSYIDLDNSPKFTKNYVKSNPMMLGYQGIGLNHKDPILKDVRVRQALCYLVNVDQMIEKVFYNKAKRTNSSVQPGKPYYNTDIKQYDYNVPKALDLLAQAGWKDTDGDGILDKIIEGKKTDLELTYLYNSGNPVRETVGLLMQRSCYQAGIRINIKPMDWSLYLDELKKHNCQLWYQGWVANPGLDDDKQIYHSSSAIDGSNYMSFGNAESDKLLDDIRTEMDSTKRQVLYMRWQQIEHDQVPYIYLYVQNFRNAIHKRFENVIEGSIYPGIWFAGLKVKKEYKVERSTGTTKDEIVAK